ncbi:DUF4185 domain-containing protein [Rhodococcus sp. 11-3]|uniref:DUF4185 domain-containing protein n=1 Tax=Rhodococcus sp. 11-3 TaxID=2854796 RepID=UPI00203E222B|nr:DUF4185 domain-containing protein [Rhodococcus sp. 11-3]USC17025.1 DUF4185 domain-containing protein [Rhodococcus sp. 11-3]
MTRTLRAALVAAFVLMLSIAYAGPATAWPWDAWFSQARPAASWQQRVTGADLDTCRRWQVCGTDLGIPYADGGTVSYLYGDTFNTPWPEQPNNYWRSPVALRSDSHPRDGIVWDSAHRGGGELFYNGHWRGGEVTVIPNDAVRLPNGRTVMSYFSVRNWDATPHRSWLTNYAGLAYTDNGNDWIRTGVRFNNNGAGNDPFQMWSMQLAGDYVYIVSVPGGRQDGPMMLRRVHWTRILDPAAYEGWGWNGRDWGWGRTPTPILHGRFGEPSLRLLKDGTWAMAYLNGQGQIVTRTAARVDGAWSPEKVQVTAQQEPNLYGGFIHPWSTKGEAWFMVSTWRRNNSGQSTAYHVSSYRGSL